MTKYKKSILFGLAASLFSFVCHANSDLKYESIASLTHAINFAASKSATKDSLDRCIDAIDSSNRDKWRPNAKKSYERLVLSNSSSAEEQVNAYRNTMLFEFGGGTHTWCFSELMIYLEYQHYPTYQILETLRSSRSEFERKWNQVDIYTFESSRSDLFWNNLNKKIDLNSTLIWGLLSSTQSDGYFRWTKGDRDKPLHLKCYDSEGNEAICRYCDRDWRYYFCQEGDLGDFRSTVRSELGGVTNQNGEQLSNYWEVYGRVIEVMFKHWNDTFLLWEQGAREEVKSEVSGEVFTYLDKEMRQLRERFSCSNSWDSSGWKKVKEESTFSLMNADVVTQYKLKPPCEI